MARAQLPRSVWLAILQALGYRELKVTQLVCRLFRDLYADCSLDEATYRKGPAAVETQPSRRAANDAEDGYDSDDDDENYVALHTLLDADDAAHGFPHAQWYGSTSFDEIAIAGPRKVRTLLCQNPAKDEMATVPALRRLVVAQNWDGIEPEPTELVNPHGVTVGQVVRAWCDLMEQALEIDEDDTVANACDILSSGVTPSNRTSTPWLRPRPARPGSKWASTPCPGRRQASAVALVARPGCSTATTTRMTALAAATTSASSSHVRSKPSSSPPFSIH
jgi:hypothetical protein